MTARMMFGTQMPNIRKSASLIGYVTRARTAETHAPIARTIMLGFADKYETNDAGNVKKGPSNKMIQMLHGSLLEIVKADCSPKKQ